MRSLFGDVGIAIV